MYEKNEQKRHYQGSTDTKGGRISWKNTPIYSDGTKWREGKQSGTTVNDGDTGTGECTT